MTNKFHIAPVDFLNTKGFNTVSLNGNLPLFSDADINVSVTVTKETPDSNTPQPSGGTYQTMIILKQADVPNASEESVKAAVIAALGVQVVQDAPQAQSDTSANTSKKQSPQSKTQTEK